MDDRELLDRYGRDGEQEAFAELVRRHSDWVYNSARRQLRDAHLAEDVTQAVFLLLARKAAQISARRDLGGWLFGTLRYCTKEALRQMVRQRREKEAAQMKQELKSDSSWEAISPVLDEAIAQLGRPDREAVLLRFYQRKPLAEVGQALGTSEEAARKRVDRAVDRLRDYLAAKGVEAQSLSLSGLILARVTEPGPEGLVTRISASVSEGIGAGTAGGIAQGVGRMMAISKMKVAAVVTVLIAGGLALAAGATWPAPTPAAAAPRGSATGESPSAAAIIEQYRKNQSAFDRCVIRSRSHMTFVNSGTGETLTETREATEYRFDGRRVDVNVATDYVRLVGRDTPPPSQSMRRIWDGNTWSVVATVNGPTPSVSAELVRDEKQKSDYICSTCEAPLLGFLPSDRQTWDTILQGAASIDVRPEGELYLLEASTSHGRYRVWLDPQKGYTVQKAQVHKGENDIAYGRPIGGHTINGNSRLKGSSATPDRDTGMDISLAVSRMERIGNTWVPMEANWTVETPYANGAVQTETRDLVREHVNLAPDFQAIQGAFVPDIPGWVPR